MGLISNSTTIELHPIDNYTFGSKPDQPKGFGEPTKSTGTVPTSGDSMALEDEEYLASLEQEYGQSGMRRSVAALLIVHDHAHPHVLLLQHGESHFILPGDGPLKPGEDEEEGVKRNLDMHMAAPADAGSMNWDVFDLVSTWWRPNFTPFMYPYLPAHIVRPKEQKRIFLVRLTDSRAFAVPKKYKLLAVPLCELLENSERYGSLIASVPHLISRINFIYS